MMPEKATTLQTCRICKSKDLTDIIDLGDLALTGRFPSIDDADPMSGRLALAHCQNCGLIQLKDEYPLEQMYGATYGYRSSVTDTMCRHLEGISQYARSFFRDKPVSVLDIGSNDGTLLSYYGNHAKNLVGVDPCGKLHAKKYPDNAIVIDDFFSAKAISESGVDTSFDIVTSIAMFYDLPDPVCFARDIYSVLADDGIWITEQTTSHTLIKQLAYDSICHEHLTYLSISDIQNICDEVGFKIIDINSNSSNGSSLRFTIAKQESSRSENTSKIESEKLKERKLDLDNSAVWEQFEKDTVSHRSKLVETIKAFRSEGKTILGFGASTKGNVILQYCNLTSEDIPAIIERDPKKVGKVTPGTRIEIISESKVDQYQPDIYLVFPWHFKEEIIVREENFLRNGGGLLFVLPNIELVTENNVTFIA